MKKIKMIVLGLVSIVLAYYTVFYIITMFHTSPAIGIVDMPLQQVSLKDLMNQPENDTSVVIQSRSRSVIENNDNVIRHDDAPQDATLNNVDYNVSTEIVVEQIESLQDDSFVLMPQHAGRLSDDVQQAFDLLIGDNIDSLLDLIAQSNNNVLSTESCRTCAIDAILKKVAKHKKLSEHEIISLQHVMANLYKFVNTMHALSRKHILAPERYIALKDLNISQVERRNLALQARQAATFAALQTLRSMDMVQRQG